MGPGDVTRRMALPVDPVTLHLTYLGGLLILLGVAGVLRRRDGAGGRWRTWAEVALVAASYPLVALADFLAPPAPVAFALVFAGMAAILAGSYRLRTRVVRAVAA